MLVHTEPAGLGKVHRFFLIHGETLLARAKGNSANAHANQLNVSICSLSIHSITKKATTTMLFARSNRCRILKPSALPEGNRDEGPFTCILSFAA